MPGTPRMEARIARRLAQKKKQLDDYRPMEPFTVQRLHADLRLLATYHSNAKELASLFETTVDYLGHLARQGKFEARKRGQHWYASKEAVEQYFQEASVQPRGRPRNKP